MQTSVMDIARTVTLATKNQADTVDCSGSLRMNSNDRLEQRFIRQQAMITDLLEEVSTIKRE